MAASATSRSDNRLDLLMQEAARRVRVERSRNLGLGVALLVILVVTYRATEFSPGQLVRGASNMTRILVAFTHPDFEIVRPGSGGFAEGLVPHFVLETLAIAVLGTSLGALLAVPLSFLAAGNLMRRNPAGSAVYFLTRMLMSVIRAVPTIFWGLLFVTAVGLGAFSGVLAVTIFSIGLMSKLFSEAIEAIDLGQVEALTATGASQLQVLVNGVMPQVLPYLIANLLYTFEVNVHSATILGLIGAGGIGFLFGQYIGQFLYADEAMVLIVVILVTMAIDYSSAAIRRRII
jgi:phosphonate transport system permease protein